MGSVYALAQVYKTLSDGVILDWYISLTDKDRMSTCDVAYAKANVTAADEDDTEGGLMLLISPFLPRQRTFLLRSLEANRTFVFHMMCEDVEGKDYVTKDEITFTTGESRTLPKMD